MQISGSVALVTGANRGVDISIPPPQAMHLVCNRAC